MIEQQVNDVPFRPDNEAHRQKKRVKSRLTALRELKRQQKDNIFDTNNTR